MKLIPALTSLLLIILLSGCHKDAVIWGTWQEISVTQEVSTNGVTTSYVTTMDSSGGVAYTFTVGGGYFSTYSDGTYRISGSTLYLTDTTLSPYRTIPLNILTLTHGSLRLQSIDTTSMSPLIISQLTYNMIPQ